MLCAIYTRLSKEDEDKHQNESESIQNQKSLLIQYACERGWDIYHIYSDEDYSGVDSLRPDFNRMIAAAEQRKFHIILCKSQSRFTRDMELVEKYIHGLFPIWGIRFIAVADNADTEVKGNKKARQINGLINEWYLEDLSENIRMVFDMKRRQGQYIGGFPIYGYQKDPENKNHLLIDSEAAEVVRQIFRWALEGHGKQHIAYLLNAKGVMSPTRYKMERGWNRKYSLKNEFGLWNKTMVWRILHNEMYTGVMVQGQTRKVSYKSKTVIKTPKEQWFRVEGTHEAIIDRETFNAVQRQTALRTREGETGIVHPLSGLVKCMDCGSTMCKSNNGSKGEGRRYYLRCKLYADSGKEKKCTRHSIRLDVLNQLVLERLRTYVDRYYTVEGLTLPEKRAARKEQLQKKQSSLRTQMEKQTAALRQLYLDKVSGLLTEGQFVDLNRDFLTEKNRLEVCLAETTKELEGAEQPKDEKSLLGKAKELLRLQTLPRELAVALIREIRVGERNPDSLEQEVVIEWKF